MGIYLKILLTLIALLQTLLFASFNGVIVDQDTLKPLNKAIVSDSKHSVKSDNNGSFSIESEENIYHVKAYGYRPYEFSKDRNETVIKVESINVKELYLTFWGASGNSKHLNEF